MTRAVGMPRRAKDVVVVIDAGWVCLEQIVCRLRAGGIEVCWVSIGLSAEAGLRRRLTVPGARNLPDVSGLDDLFAEYAGRNVLDVLSPESHLDTVTALAERHDFPSRVVEELRRRLLWTDKLEAGRRLEAAGIPTPRKVDLSSASLQDAVRELGFPLVLKGRVGAGGDSVAVVDSLESADHAYQTLESRGFTLFAEEYLEGEAGQYAAAYLPGGRIVQECTYVSRRRTAFGPPVGARSIDAPVLVEVGRASLRTFGGYGMSNVETIQTPDGRQLVIDLNLRPWGTFMSWREVGVDFMDGYLQALGLQPASGSTQVAPAHRDVDVYPSASKVLVQENLWRGVVDYAASSLKYLRWVGPRYVAMTTVAFAKYILIGEPTGVPGERVGGLRASDPDARADVTA